MDNACIIGFGVVGKATASAFGITKRYSHNDSNITLEEAAKCRYIFICLPTPTVSGACYTKDIYDIIQQISTYPRYADNVFIIRSTVYPGFNRFLQTSLKIGNVVNNPEFLSEATAEEDAKNPEFIVLGSDNPKYLMDVKALYEGRFKYKDIITTDSVTAELIKYSLNVFFATKVIFANEIYDFARRINANYEVIRQVLEKHPWGSKNHFRIWYKEKRGVHGRCLPKDTEAFSELSNSRLFKVLLEINERIKNERYQ